MDKIRYGIIGFGAQGSSYCNILTDMAVVDDRAKGGYPFTCLGGLLHQLDGTADTETETGTFCQFYTHNGIFSPMMRFNSAITPSISSAEVSTLMESRASFRGATSRWVSW